MSLSKLKKGFSLLELVLAIAIFALSSVATGYLIIDANAATDANSKKVTATLLAREGIEAVRSIRDASGFSAISGANSGTHGLAFSSTTWAFASTSDVSADGVYTRVITLGVGSDAKTEIATSTVSAISGSRTIATTLVTQFTAWR